MRVWDISPSQLCDQHLIAQHHEIHCIYNIITDNKTGFRNHPEVKRWESHLPALCSRHFQTVMEMENRGMSHYTCLFMGELSIPLRYPEPWQSIPEQIALLESKECECLKEVKLQTRVKESKD